MCTNMFAWLLKILCQTFIAFDQNKIIYDNNNKIRTILSVIVCNFTNQRQHKQLTFIHYKLKKIQRETDRNLVYSLIQA